MGDRWLIYSRERQAWWKPQARGYTNDVALAGIYDLETALRICCGAAPLTEAEGGGPRDMLAPGQPSPPGELGTTTIERLRATQHYLDRPMGSCCFRVQVSGVRRDDGKLDLTAAARQRAVNIEHSELINMLIMMLRSVRAIRNETADKIAADAGISVEALQTIIDRIANDPNDQPDMVSVIAKAIDSESEDPA